MKSNWLIGLILGGLGLLILANPSGGIFGNKPGQPASPPPVPPNNNATGTPGFSVTGAGNTIRTVGGIVGGVADIIGQITNRGIVPNVGSLLGPQQVTPPNMADMNQDFFKSAPSGSQLVDSSTSSNVLPYFDNPYAGGLLN